MDLLGRWVAAPERVEKGCICIHLYGFQLRTVSAIQLSDKRNDLILTTPRYGQPNYGRQGDLDLLPHW